MMRPNGSEMNEWPKNCRPCVFGSGSKPTRLGDATNTPLAIACARWIVRHASTWRVAKLVPLARMPADRRRIEQDVGAQEGRDPRALGVPLVPADQHADVGITSVPDAEAV